ncbi:MAG: phage head closure protein [Pseudomonadota bacterium]
MGNPTLSRRLTLERRDTVLDSGGGETGDWVALGTHWAELKPASGRERVSGDRPGARVTHKVTIRSAPIGSSRRPDATQRFRLGSRVFDIRGVADADDAGAFLICWVEEGPYA